MDQQQPVPPAPAQPQGQPQAGGPPKPYALFYVLSFIIWIVGIILGIIYLRKPDAESKKFGKMCLILGIISVAITIIIWIIWVVFWMSVVTTAPLYYY